MKHFIKLEKYCAEKGIKYTNETAEKFGRFCDLLIEKNKVMNLTAITDPEEIEIKHFIDSLSSYEAIKSIYGNSSDIGDTGRNQFRIIDIGTGAGFPGIPLSIVMPELSFVLADSLNKRINFVDEVIKDIKISNVETITARAEEIGQSTLRESIEICVSRAVADMTVLLEYCLPLVKVGGSVILYKSGDYKEELERARYAIDILGGELKDTREFILPYTDQNRSLIIINKRNAAPTKYPRRAGKPSKSPLFNK